MNRYRIVRNDRAATGCPPVDTIVFDGFDSYSLHTDDRCRTGFDYIACSINPEGYPFFTIPRVDVEKVRG